MECFGAQVSEPILHQNSEDNCKSLGSTHSSKFCCRSAFCNLLEFFGLSSVSTIVVINVVLVFANEH